MLTGIGKLLHKYFGKEPGIIDLGVECYGVDDRIHRKMYELAKEDLREPGVFVRREMRGDFS